jgi:hypothetical protein
LANPFGTFPWALGFVTAVLKGTAPGASFHESMAAPSRDSVLSGTDGRPNRHNGAVLNGTSRVETVRIINWLMPDEQNLFGT